MKKLFIGNKRGAFVVFLLTIIITTSLIASVNSRTSLTSSQSVNAMTSNTSSDNCGCNKKEKLAEIYDKPSDVELKNLISVTKSQKIYKDYAEFLNKKGYIEYTKGVFGGFFKKTPVIKKDAKYIGKNSDFDFSYDANLKVNKPYILSVPFVNTSDSNNIAGIIFVYTQQRILSYVIEANGIKDPNSADIRIAVEASDGEFKYLSNNATIESVYIDWSCVGQCIPGALWDCLPWMGTPVYPACTAAAWAFCYDVCTLSKP